MGERAGDSSRSDGERPAGTPEGSAPSETGRRQRNLKLTIEYDGTLYFGWQSQRDRPTVQDELEKAISRVVDHPVTVYGSGRTDRGVHALGQVANFRTSKPIPAPKLLLGVNTYLPEDIRVLQVEEVPEDFHARHSARGKRYRYTILRSRVERVMARRFCEVVPIALDMGAMRRGAEAFGGMRDYRAFRGNAKRRAPEPGEEARSTVRTLAAVTVRESGPFVFIDAFGKGFLYGMVRTIAGTILEVGMAKRNPGSLEEIFLSGDRRRAGFTASARGLCLLQVYYQDGLLESEALAAREGREPLEGSPAAEHERYLKLLI